MNEDSAAVVVPHISNSGVQSGRGGGEIVQEEGGGREIDSITNAVHQSEEMNQSVVGEEDDSDNTVNDFKSEIVDGKALYFCSECNYQR